MKKPLILLLHLGYWLVYLLLAIMMMYVLSVESGMGNDVDEEVIAAAFFFMVLLPAIATFYASYFFIFPTYFPHRKYSLAFGVGLLITLGSTLVGTAILTFGLYPACAAAANAQDLLAFVGVVSCLNLIGGTVGLVIKGFSTWFEEVAQKEQLQEKNFAIEMALVKSQLDPHFLFNTINNIDVLILRDAEQASEYLNRLSDIMRFMLYETKTATIPLKDELTYLEKYIALQKIRTANEYYVDYDVTGNVNGQLIAPMTLIPFVENAFKHTSNKKIIEAIQIRVAVTPKYLTFTCINKVDAQPTTSWRGSGIGNELIRKRLELMYAEKHQLEMGLQEKEFRVHLTLKT